MNRIYQGRVSNVEISTGDKNEPWQALPDWTNKLWQHHQLFQDAINYYIVALASLADPGHATNRLIKDLRARVEAAWPAFPRSVNGHARGLRESIAGWLQLPNNASIAEAFAVVLDGIEATPEVRTLALALLLDRCGGESAVQQGGRGYLPRFCDAQAKPTYDFSPHSQAAGIGKNRLSEVLHGNPTQTELVKLANEMQLSWTVKLQPDEFFTPEESSARLLEAIEHVRRLLLNPTTDRVKAAASQFPSFEDDLDSFKGKIKNGSKKIIIPRNRKASKDLTFATLTFKFLPCPLTAKVLSLYIKKPKASTTPKTVDDVDFAVHGDDPIKLARGRRGFVFRAFTALPAWNPKSPGEPVWKEFDIAAFKEALKSLNQFNQKTQERIDDEDNLRGQLAIILGSKMEGWKPRKTDTNEDEPAPEPLDPVLFKLARELEHDLTQDLADTVLGQECSAQFGEAVHRYREGEWQVSQASLRGYSDIASEWNGFHAAQGDKVTVSQLEDIVKKHQREEKNKNSIGSIPLFLKLCERKYWPLWLVRDDDSDEGSSENSFLHSMVLFHAKFRDLERSREPINLTPAEPKHSRRLFMFSDLTDKVAKVAFGKTDAGFTVECAIALAANDGRMKEQRVRLHYSAKRLLRDELLGGVESRWLQPMTRALDLKTPENAEETLFESAVSLMPDPVRSTGASKTEETRFLLNFPVTLDPAWIHQGLGKSAVWKGQFNGTREKNLHLHWPQTMKGKANVTPWWKNKHIIKHGFTCISVDLGQRTAGAWALLRATCWDPRNGKEATKRPVREIGFDGKLTWFAEVLSTGILRLSGEDQKVRGSDGKIKTEDFGKSGRNALESEWIQGKELAKALLADNPEAWLGNDAKEKSFPEQNDALIALANRRLSRLNTFHRWSCFDPDRPEVAARRSSLIEKLIDELEHWESSEVKSWKTLVESGQFAKFREASGGAFNALREKMRDHLTALANRVAPLRKKSWRWDGSCGNSGQGLFGQLVDTGAPLMAEAAWLRGQRGLSLARIKQLEDLRRLFLRYNRSFDRAARVPVRFGPADFGRRSGEPCRLLLEKIERMKEERVNQTAHLILAEALGVRLTEHQIDPKQRETRDIHGEYEKIPGRTPADFIVIENLDRYLTSQGRAPAENSRLMKWSHRAVRDKIKMLAEEPFGIPVVEAAAAYSSRFCAVTGMAGSRCEELSELTEHLKELFEKRAKLPTKAGQPDPKIFATFLDQFNELAVLNEKLLKVREGKMDNHKARFTLFIPKLGGPLFLPVSGKKGKIGRAIPRQADINAATNIGLRAMAAPTALDVLHKVRSERNGDGFKPISKNARERAVFDQASVITVNGNASATLAKARTANFFFDAGAIGGFDLATLKLTQKTIPVTSGVGLWASVNQLFPNALADINRRRLDEWQKQLSSREPISA